MVKKTAKKKVRVWVDEEQYKYIVAVAERKKTTKSDALRYIIEDDMQFQMREHTNPRTGR